MDFLLPKLSATMESAKVLRWLKKAGDRISAGEPLVELETDKAAMEVESPAAGILEELLAEEGADVAVGAALARLRGAGEGRAAAPIGAPAKAAAAASAPLSAPPVAPPPPARVLASPYAKHLARLNGVELAKLASPDPRRGLRGRDVLAAVSAKAPSSTGREGFEPLSAMRSGIAAAVALSRKTIPAFVLDRWVETTAIDKARARDRAAAEKPTLTDYLLLALSQALAAHPLMLERWHEDGGRAGRIRTQSVDIGLVVALADGLSIPVLRDLAGKTLSEIARLRLAAAARARAGKLIQADAAPVAVSISNLGAKGADRFEAIINPGQTAILAVGRAHERIVPRQGAIAIASGVNLTLSVDHRLIDGRVAAEFLETLASRVGGWPSV